MYKPPLIENDVDELVYRIHQAFTTISPEMLKKVWHDYLDRIKEVVKENGNFVDIHEENENRSIQNEVKAMRWVSHLAT